MSINEKAFHAAWGSVGWDTQNPHAEDGQRRFIAAYESAKAAQQPDTRPHNSVYKSPALNKDASQSTKLAKYPPTTFNPNIHCDAERVIAWIDNPERKPAQMAFTEGLERQIAYRFEGALMKRESQPVPTKADEKPVGCRKALKRLVDLKAHKDAHGKNNWYVKNQKDAWDQAKAALAGAPERESGWRPIETAPKDGTRILIPAKCAGKAFYVTSVCYVGGYDSGDVWYETASGMNHYSPGVWMPLPNPPTDIESGKP